jgi:hypothetical protein
VCVLAAAGSGAAGEILIALGLGDYQASVAPAYEAYLAEPEGSTGYDALYQAYRSAYTPFLWKTWGGIGLAAAGVALGTTSIVLLASPATPGPAATAVSVSLLGSVRQVLDWASG